MGCLLPPGQFTSPLCIPEVKRLTFWRLPMCFHMLVVVAKPGAEKRAFDPKAPKHVFEGLLHPPPFEEKVLFKAYDPFGEVRLGKWKISFGTEGSETCF